MIRKIAKDGTVTTVSGRGSSGFTDGTGSAAKFNNPKGVAVDVNGNLFVADADNNAIRKVTKEWRRNHLCWVYQRYLWF